MSGTVAEVESFSRFLGTTVKDDMIKVHRRTRTAGLAFSKAFSSHPECVCVCVD